VKRHQLPLFPLILFLIGWGVMDALSKAPAITGEGCFAWSTAKGCQSSPDFARMLDFGGKGFLARTGFSQQTHPPVFVTLHSRTENAASFPYLKVDALEGGMPRISVDLQEGKRQEGRDRKEVIQNEEEGQQLLMAALLLREYYEGGAPLPGFRVPQFPAWVTRGLATLCFPAEEPFRIPSSYLKVKGGNPPTLEDFLIQRPPERSDPTISDLYDASAACLLKSGLSTSAGQAAFREWVGHDDQNQPDRVPSRWVGGWEMRPVERRWLLLMAGSSADGNGEIRIQSVADSMKAYDAVMAEVPEGASIHSLALDKKSGGYTLAKLSERLTTLHLRANPLVLPLLDQTIILVAKSQKFPAKKITAEEKRLAELREVIVKQSRAIDEYLDWYEAAKLPLRSGTFDKFLQNQETVIKKGPVGGYLDIVEKRGW
jgi:hypothetical protein